MSDAYKIKDKMMARRAKMTFADMLRLMPLMTDGTRQRLQEVRPPKTIAGHDVPNDLQLITYADLCELQRISRQDATADKVVTEIVAQVTGCDADDVMGERAIDVMGVVNMVREEIRRIGKLFASLKGDHTSEELQAGVEFLDFGTFGIIDWYARRMGITDHDVAYNTKWQRIYECLRIDKEQADYERRLRQVYNNQHKRRR